ncbi:MAG: low molecular weight protein-tyrosine-phosphatase [Oscillospiraceae bacterium]
MIKILFVCHGNICRSPMAEFVMKDLVQKAGLAGEFRIESAATSTEEIGNPVYPPARRKLAEHGIGCAGKTARQMRKEDYGRFDYLIGMDSANLRNMRRICGGDPEGKMSLLLTWADRPMGTPAKPEALLGRGGARERARDARQGVPRQSGLCDDEVADPWYTGDFEATWNDVYEGCKNLLEQLR